MYESSLRNELQIRRFTIRHRPTSGWEVLDETESQILRRSVYHDWHRVERAIAAFQREEAELEADGWVKLPGLTSRPV